MDGSIERNWPSGAASADGMLLQAELRQHAAGEFSMAAGRGGGGRDALADELRQHAAGEISMAAAQANLVMEEQAQVLASPGATLVGVHDGHDGPDASRFLRSSLCPHVQRMPTMQRRAGTE
ncbi:hypothetical protein QYE76_069273 [Lolium multiflorum]|uniref:protein-serine/threonine phosphatase n=1 Tax=Lolium multiflorum TaxID=4521 RepID=A0AAD8WCS0_LOLMU|nr:hypothetical protein QYE76_069273 [Lolium multiflorum]